MKKPTPKEVEELRALFPKGAPRLDYREMTLSVGRAAAVDNGDEADETPADPDAPLRIAISSEAPVLRYDWWDNEYYFEVLDHSAKSVILDYVTDGMPFVSSHRSWDADSQHGIVENVSLDKDRVMRGDVRFSRAPESQRFAMDMRDGIRKKVSVGYIVGDEFTQTATKGSEYPTRRYTAWMPIETSTVPVPADYNVGLGRAQAPEGQAAIARFLSLVLPRTAAVSDPSGATPTDGERSAAIPALPAAPSTTQAPKAEERHMETNNAPAGGTPAADPSVIVIRERVEAARNEETQRISNIRSMAESHAVDPEKVQKWIGSGTGELEVAREINDILAKRMKEPLRQDHGPDISERDANRFSMARALMIGNELEGEFRSAHPGGGRVDFGLEREMLTEMAGRMAGPQNGGSVLPIALLGRQIATQVKGRDGIDSATSTTGGPFKFTQPGDFIPILRNRSSVIRAGSTVLTGLTGPVSFPRQTAAASANWSAENPGADISTSNLLTGTVTLAFKSVAAGTLFTRQMLFAAASGNFDIEAIVQDDLNKVLGLAIDLAGLNGSGSSNQPKGVLKNTAIGSVPIGTNGGTATWDNWVDLETKIAQANADTSRMAYLTNNAQRGTAKKKAVLNNTASGTPIWSGPYADGFDGIVNGYRALTSEQVPANLTKGTSTTVCSAIVFGAWEYNLIGMFGPGFETVVDPYSKKFQGAIEVAAWAYCDVAQRYDGAFAAIQDAL